MSTQINFLKTWFQMHVKDERGASLVEYALLVALIAVVCIIAVTALGQGISNEFDAATTGIASGGAATP
jgi:pilus assembly protein Flp/PilA